MTGYDVYERAMILLGNTDTDGNVADGAAVIPSALAAINIISADLFGGGELKDIFDRVDAEGEGLSALVYGAAMLLALILGEAEQNRVFCSLYNASRGKVKAQTAGIKDVLPSFGEGI